MKRIIDILFISCIAICYYAMKEDEEKFECEILQNTLYSTHFITFKIIAIGNTNVAGSDFFNKIATNHLIKGTLTSPGYYNFPLKINNIFIRLQIRDFSNKILTSTLLEENHLVMLFYSVNDRESFEYLNSWTEDVNNEYPPNVKKFLIGIKTDLEDERKVTKENGEFFKNENKFDYFAEVSSKGNLVDNQHILKDLNITVLENKVKINEPKLVLVKAAVELYKKNKEENPQNKKDTSLSNLKKFEKNKEKRDCFCYECCQKCYNCCNDNNSSS